MKSSSSLTNLQDREILCREREHHIEKTLLPGRHSPGSGLASLDEENRGGDVGGWFTN